MHGWLITLITLLVSLVLSRMARGAELVPPLSEAKAGVRVFDACGVILEVQTEARKIAIHHETISNYMDEMTMSFKVKAAVDLAGLQRGDRVNFRLHVNDKESWIDHIAKTGKTAVAENPEPAGLTTNQAPTAAERQALLDYQFTNELGQAVSLNDFRGQAVAITFFYTRCPLPEYCPRLSKNFQEASQKLKVMAGAPANWHFISVSFDTESDSPALLKAYGDFYSYDPAHWSFLTGPADKVRELARQCGMEYKLEDGTFNHNFRTLIIDASGHLQMVFPTGGDLSDPIVSEIVKAAAATESPRQAIR